MTDIQALEDRVAELEEALHHAIWKVEFMHGCLTDPKHYSYAYPEMTVDALREWRELAPELCFHSFTRPGCPACEDRNRRFAAQAERKAREEAKGVKGVFALAVVLARCRLEPDPQPGDLVVEVSQLRRGADPDAIGWLVARGEAPYAEDGSGPTRDVWDVTPLTGALGVKGRPYQRWENAEFYKVPDSVVKRLELSPPEGWHSDFGLTSQA